MLSVPSRTELQGAVVEIAPYEMGQPFKNLLLHQKLLMAFTLTDSSGHLQYAVFICGDLCFVTVAILVLPQCHLPYEIKAQMLAF